VQRTAGNETRWFDSAAKTKNGVGREGHNFVQILATKQAERRLPQVGSFQLEVIGNQHCPATIYFSPKAMLYRTIYSLRAVNFQEKGR
jgi:hypothetical protein